MQTAKDSKKQLTQSLAVQVHKVSFFLGALICVLKCCIAAIGISGSRASLPTFPASGEGLD